MVRKLFLGIAVVIGIIIQVPANEAASNISTYLDRFLALFGSTNSSLHSPAWLRHQAVDTSIVVALIALCIILVLQLLVPTLRKLIIRPERPSSTSASTASLHKKLAVLSYTRLRRLCRLSTVLRLVVRKATRYARLYVPLEYEVKHFPYSTNSRDFGYFRDDLSAFCSRFIDAFPGSSLLTEIEGTKEIIMRLHVLLRWPTEAVNEACSSGRSTRVSPFWWTTGDGNMYITRYKWYKRNKVLINEREITPSYCAAIRGVAYWQTFVYLECSALPIHRKIPCGEYEQVFGIYGRRIINHSQIVDGGLVRRGRPVHFDHNPDMRTRNLRNLGILLTSQSSEANTSEHDQRIQRHIALVLEDREKVHEFKEFLTFLPKPYVGH